MLSTRPGDTSGDHQDSSEQVVLAVDFGGSKTAIAVCSLSGTRLDETVAEVTPTAGAATNFDHVVEVAHRLLAGRAVAAVGACTFGIPTEEGVALSPAIGGWDELPLGRRLGEVFSAPVSVVTDVKAAAAAESRHGALAGADPAIYLNLGTGLAVALVVGGEVVRGAQGASGEIGYNLPGRWHPSPAPASSDNGASVVVEDLVSGMGLARALAAAQEFVPTPHDGSATREARIARSIDDARKVAELFDGFESNPVHAAILKDFLDELCFQIVNLAIAVNPARIAVGGGLVRSWGQIAAPLRRALDAHVPYPPELVVGEYPFDAALRGAIDLGVALATGMRPPIGAESWIPQPSARSVQ